MHILVVVLGYYMSNTIVKNILVARFTSKLTNRISSKHLCLGQSDPKGSIAETDPKNCGMKNVFPFNQVVQRI